MKLKNRVRALERSRGDILRILDEAGNDTRVIVTSVLEVRQVIRELHESLHAGSLCVYCTDAPAKEAEPSPAA